MGPLADLFWLLALVAGCAYWWRAHGMKERALSATRRHCREMEVELLDDTVVLKGCWLKRDGARRWQMWRSYLFEFTTTGEQRYSGRIVLLGDRVETIQLAPHRFDG